MLSMPIIVVPMNQVNDHTVINCNIDPDLNFVTPDISCDYYDVYKFSSDFNNNTCTKLLHVNARSLKKNISNIIEFVNLVGTRFSVIGISETWLTDTTDPLIQINDYSIEGSCRKNKKGGGVALYIKQDLNYNNRNDLSVNNSEIESFFIELVNTHCSNVLIGVVYKPPSASCDNFSEYINDILENISAEGKKCFIMGDFNINILQYETNDGVHNFIDMLHSQSFYPTINKPTRITENSATVIDNILINDLHNHTAGVLVSDISDHLPVFLIIDDSFEKPQDVGRLGTKRVFNSNNTEHFVNDLNTTDWYFMTSLNDTHSMYNSFINHVLELYDKSFPLQEVKCRYNKRKSPWLSDGIYKSIRRKNYLYKKLMRHPTSQNKSIYTMYKNKLNTLIKVSKKSYFCTRFNQEKGNIKGTWNVINAILNKGQRKSNPSYFVQDGITIDEDKDIADRFNEYFVSVGTRLASNLPLCNNTFESFLQDRQSNSLFLNPITQEEIIDILNKIPDGKAPGFDGLSAFVIKRAKHALAKPLACIFNESLITGIFPDGLKNGKVTPIHKGGDKHNIANYRPISVLTTFSKVFEKLIYHRLINFIDKHNILSDSQFGFREGRSTELATSHVVNKLLKAIDDGKFSVGIFLDLSKAFDTVNHKILFCKLENYGVRGIALNWFKSYLSNRIQIVSYNCANSDEQPICCGVPQGSVLGPLLFLIYINDISYTSDKVSFCLFADDTSLVYSHNNVDTAIQILNIELEKISSWLLANKLCINLLKSNYMIFCSRQHKYTQSVPLVLNGVNLKCVTITKFLGVSIDENLTWKSHVSEVSSKISKTVGIMNRLKTFIPSDILLILYNSFVLPYLNYSVLTWGSSSVNCDKLLFLQKRAVRIISSAGYRDHTADLFVNLKLLRFKDIYYLNLGKLMYKYTNNALPGCFISCFELTSNIHSYNTRSASSKNIHVCYNRTSLYKNSLIQRGVNYWNGLNESIKKSPSQSIFVGKLKKQLLDTHA